MSHSLQVLVIADDLTGAAEAGAIFSEQGLDTVVATDFSVSSVGAESATQVLVVDTESRHIDPAEAHARVRELAAAATVQGVPLIYKKTDSTLRGNIGSELCALRSVSAAQLLFYIPAYPEMGRTVRAGHLYVNGELVTESPFALDALSPVKSSYVPDVLSRQSCEPVFLVKPTDIAGATRPGIYICDGETDRDLQQAAESLLARCGRTLAAGPSGLARCIAHLISSGPETKRGMPQLRRCLIVNGSRHQQSRQQVEYARSLGWGIFTPGEMTSLAGGWSVLHFRSEDRQPAGEFAAELGKVVCNVVREGQLDGLIIFGGDTAYGILSALGESRMYPVAEILPGVPIARVVLERRTLHVVTKAGGFGSFDVLPQIRLRVGG